MHTRLILVALTSLTLALSACQPAPTSPSDSADRADEPMASEAGQEAASGEEAEAAQEPGAGSEEPSSGDSGASPDASSDASSDGELVASVNGEPIELTEFQRQAFDTQRFFVDQGLDPNSDDGQRRLRALRRQVLDDMINQKLIEQAGIELGLEVTDDELDRHVATQIENAGGQDSFDETIEQAGTTLDQVRAMERAALIGQKVLEAIVGDIPQTSEFVHARHILCDAQEACEEALARLESGEDFADVAKEISIDTASADRGGDLDWVGRGLLPSQQVEDAIFALESGERSGVVATDFGYHIFEAIERDEDHELTEEQKYQLQEKALLDWLAKKRSESEILIYVEDLQGPVE